MVINVSIGTPTNRDPGPAVERARRRYFLDVATRGFRVSQERVPTDTSQLRQSGVRPQERLDGSVIWGYRADYARPVEEGSRPHWPPIEPLRGWARRVLGNESAAYAVQAKIAEEGTDAQPFVEPSVRAMRRFARSRGMGQYIEEELSGP